MGLGSGHSDFSILFNCLYYMLPEFGCEKVLTLVRAYGLVSLLVTPFVERWHDKTNNFLYQLGNDHHVGRCVMLSTHHDSWQVYQ
ncbi:hypothetical protein MTR_1g028590 [Medicago truncatula]|uniref:Uncharacterized protein n=1 Tax=Medicago truncatula TaxID=3880 RepID=A0A072VFR6_MEDTR|nr:hypothetical protein MTR_1g028590 [Medicago truncatula]